MARAAKLPITAIWVPGHLQQADSGTFPEASNYKNSGTRILQETDRGACSEASIPQFRYTHLQQSDSGRYTQASIFFDWDTKVFATNRQWHLP